MFNQNLTKRNMLLLIFPDRQSNAVQDMRDDRGGREDVSSWEGLEKHHKMTPTAEQMLNVPHKSCLEPSSFSCFFLLHPDSRLISLKHWSRTRRAEGCIDCHCDLSVAAICVCECACVLGEVLPFSLHEPMWIRDRSTQKWDSWLHAVTRNQCGLSGSATSC